MTAVKPKDIYRGRRRWRTLLTVLLLIVVLLIIAAIVLFYSLQKYVVITQDGVSLVLPFMDEPVQEEQPDPETVTEIPTEIVIETPDFGEVEAQAGAQLSPIWAVFVPADEISGENLSAYAAALESQGANALVLDMKPESGQLSWISEVYEASAFGLSGSQDLREPIADLKERGVYLVARISCCVDEMMASRNTPLALKTPEGELYSDSAGYWLDPYNRSVREYIISLMKELADMGFDEILLANVAHPAERENIAYSQDMSAAVDVVSCVSNFALKVTDAMENTGVRVSALFDRASLTEGSEPLTGQDLEFFYVVFDRIYMLTDGEKLGSDMQAAQAAMNEGAVESRFVPIVDTAPGTGSWVLK
ncbi:MAG: putative glycoside hydrolase [Oscillospiraceae bacterium]|jgi:hypothetical protein